MKKITAILAAVTILAACNSGTTETTETKTDSTAVKTDSTKCCADSTKVCDSTKVDTAQAK